ncbi:MAG: GNAT family N-acetyltransferase [Clostridia bacterium]|nr:GNAT family N-acetyltransferase [Clostridia bacterium]
MKLERLNENNKHFYNDAYSLYVNAFPLIERRDKLNHNIALTFNDYHFDFIIKDNNLIGIMLYWEDNDFIFLEHFAILNNLRNNGYGKMALNLLKEKNKTIILEVEQPNDELTTRRLNFYKRNGFILTNHNHKQLKFRKNDQELTLKILSYPLPINSEEYNKFYNFLHSKVQSENN